MLPTDPLILKNLFLHEKGFFWGGDVTSLFHDHQSKKQMMQMKIILKKSLKITSAKVARSQSSNTPRGPNYQRNPKILSLMSSPNLVILRWLRQVI